jgi:3-oxoacyl-[acyl-carrier protein] reductase
VTLEIDLNGSRALVTGAGQGVGRAIAVTLAQGGATVLVNDVVADRAGDVVKEIRNAGGAAEEAPFDVTDWSAVEAAFDGQGIDILVNNAGNAGTEGFADMRPFAQSDPAEWGRYISVNLFGVMNCVRGALPGMIEQSRGRVVTIVSDAGRYGDPYLAPYAAAKAGAAGFCRSIAREVGRHGITVNCVSLGTISTPATVDSVASDEVMKRYIIRRRGEPEDVAGLVAYLASPLASWITGQTYPVNGGYTVSL